MNCRATFVTVLLLALAYSINAQTDCNSDPTGICESSEVINGVCVILCDKDCDAAFRNIAVCPDTLQTFQPVISASGDPGCGPCYSAAPVNRVCQQNIRKSSSSSAACSLSPQVFGNPVPGECEEILCNTSSFPSQCESSITNKADGSICTIGTCVAGQCVAADGPKIYGGLGISGSRVPIDSTEQTLDVEVHAFFFSLDEESELMITTSFNLVFPGDSLAYTTTCGISLGSAIDPDFTMSVFQLTDSTTPDIFPVNIQRTYPALPAGSYVATLYCREYHQNEANQPEASIPHWTILAAPFTGEVLLTSTVRPVPEFETFTSADTAAKVLLSTTVLALVPTTVAVSTNFQSQTNYDAVTPQGGIACSLPEVGRSFAFTRTADATEFFGSTMPLPTTASTNPMTGTTEPAPRLRIAPSASTTSTGVTEISADTTFEVSCFHNVGNSAVQEMSINTVSWPVAQNAAYGVIQASQTNTLVLGKGAEGIAASHLFTPTFNSDVIVIASATLQFPQIGANVVCEVLADQTVMPSPISGNEISLSLSGGTAFDSQAVQFNRNFFFVTSATTFNLVCSAGLFPVDVVDAQITIISARALPRGK